MILATFLSFPLKKKKKHFPQLLKHQNRYAYIFQYTDPNPWFLWQKAIQILMDLLLFAVNLLLRKTNISFALLLVPLKRVKMDLSLSLGTLMRTEKEHAHNKKAKKDM